MLATTIAAPAMADPACANNTCVTATLRSDGLQAALVDHCPASVHCEVCPVSGGKVDLSRCLMADLDPGGDTELVFTEPANRIATKCLDSVSMDVCSSKMTPLTPGWSAHATETVRSPPPPPPPRQKESGVPIASTPASVWKGAGLGRFTIELLGTADGTPGEPDTYPSMFWGGGVRFAIQAMAAPDHPGAGDSTWYGIRAGLGADWGVELPLAQIGPPTLLHSGQTAGASTPYNFGFAMQVPAFVGFQASLGSFDTPTRWTGWTIGLDYQPMFTLNGVAPVGFNLHVATAEYEPRATASLHGHFDANVFVVVPINAPLTAGGSVGVIFQ